MLSTFIDGRPVLPAESDVDEVAATGSPPSEQPADDHPVLTDRRRPRRRVPLRRRSAGSALEGTRAPGPAAVDDVDEGVRAEVPPRVNWELDPALDDSAVEDVSGTEDVVALDDPVGAVSSRTALTACLVIVLAVSLSVALSALVHPSAPLYRTGVTVHLLSVVLGLGAVLLIDWHGLLWLLRRRTLGDGRRLADAAAPLIWSAFAGLLASGTVLRPDLSATLTWVKLAAVLVIGLNGVEATAFAHRLLRFPPDSSLSGLPGRVRARLVASALTSQAGWWAAVVIGLITDARRH